MLIPGIAEKQYGIDAFTLLVRRPRNDSLRDALSPARSEIMELLQPEPEPVPFWLDPEDPLATGRPRRLQAARREAEVAMTWEARHPTSGEPNARSCFRLNRRHVRATMNPVMPKPRSTTPDGSGTDGAATPITHGSVPPIPGLVVAQKLTYQGCRCIDRVSRRGKSLAGTPGRHSRQQVRARSFDFQSGFLEVEAACLWR